jgi:hypothetical protein
VRRRYYFKIVVEGNFVKSSTSGIRLAKAPPGVFSVEVPPCQEMITEGFKEMNEILGS